MNKFFLIANPVSGNGKAKRDWKKVSDLLLKYEMEFDFVFTEKPQHEKELVINAIKKGYRKFISLGGDGTLNEMLNGVFIQPEISTKDITIGVIPVGTGNDWCRMFSIPDDYEKAIQVIKSGKTFLHDIGVVEYSKTGENNKHFFIIMAGLGYDAFVAIKMNAERTSTHGGRFFYYIGILKYLFKYQPVEMEFSIDGSLVSGKVLTACVAVCKYNGGGMMQAPFAVADDGLLDITIISEMSKAEMLLNMPRLRNGSFVKNKHVRTFKARKVEVRSAPISFVEADGETLGQTPALLSILPKAVQMIVK